MQGDHYIVMCAGMAHPRCWAVARPLEGLECLHAAAGCQCCCEQQPAGALRGCMLMRVRRWRTAAAASRASSRPMPRWSSMWSWWTSRASEGCRGEGSGAQGALGTAQARMHALWGVDACLMSQLPLRCMLVLQIILVTARMHSAVHSEPSDAQIGGDQLSAGVSR